MGVTGRTGMVPLRDVKAGNAHSGEPSLPSPTRSGFGGGWVRRGKAGPEVRGAGEWSRASGDAVSLRKGEAALPGGDRCELE